MPLKRIKLLIAALYALAISNGLYAQVANDTLSLSIEQLFARISRQHLQLAADRLKELMATERTQTARTARLPEINIGLRGGFLGQPIVWQNGLSHATRPESPDWQQNYAIDFNQPLYQGGKIRYAIRQADLQQELALLQTSATKPTSNWPYWNNTSVCSACTNNTWC